jgi:general secretion pathway protein D
VAGQVSNQDQRSLSGIPGLGFVPGLNQVMANNTKQETEDELLVVITPHVVANTVRTTPEIWVSER